MGLLRIIAIFAVVMVLTCGMNVKKLSLNDIRILKFDLNIYNARKK